jgi:multidrug efflux pump subunit AcrA (membrane-fusion protein)
MRVNKVGKAKIIMFKRLQIMSVISVLAVGVFVYLRLQFDHSAMTPLAAAVTATSTPSVLQTVVIDQGDILNIVSATGMIQPNQNVPLAFEAVGRVTSLAVAQGDHVLKGQVIATLDDRLATDALLAAQGQVIMAQLALRNLTDKPRQADVNVTKAALALAQAQLDEVLHSVDGTNLQIANAGVSLAQNNLYLQQLNRDAVEQQKEKLREHPQTAGLANQLPNSNAENAPIDSAQYGVQIAQANATSLQGAHGNVGAISAAQAQVTIVQNALDKQLKGADVADIARAQANLQGAQSALDQVKANRAKLTLVAPFDGLIAKLYLNLGQQTPSGPAALLLDTSSFYVDLPIPEVNIAQVALGQNATLTFKALPGKMLTGKVTRLADTGVKMGSVVTYMVRVVIDPSDQALLGSMTTTASITTGKAINVVRIPNRLIRTDMATGKRYALVRQTNDQYQEIAISLGAQDDTFSQVISGLKVGDVVIPPQSH